MRPPLQANLSQVILKPWYIEDLVYLLSPIPWDSHPCPRPSYRLCTNLKSHIFIYVYLIQIFSLAHTLTRSTRASNRLSSCKINTGTLAYHFCQTWIPSIMTFKNWNLIQSLSCSRIFWLYSRSLLPDVQPVANHLLPGIQVNQLFLLG